MDLKGPGTALTCLIRDRDSRYPAAFDGSAIVNRCFAAGPTARVGNSHARRRGSTYSA
jgi:hypothetical protein